MPYYIRVLGTQLDRPALEQLREVASPALVDGLTEQSDLWSELVLKHASGQEIAIIERNETADGLGADELAEFMEEVAETRPTSAAVWLKNYLSKVKVIYAFQLLPGTDVEDGWGKLHAIYDYVWTCAKGILQADGEGFTNEDGFTVVWQFSETVSGPWNLAVLTNDNIWTSFEMDLSNRDQRAAFLHGEVPSGAKLVK